MAQENEVSRSREDENIELRISPVVVKRLALYLNSVDQLLRKNPGQNHYYISSKELAALAGVKPVQVRKDFSMFGTFGTPGVGYQVDELKQKLVEILNLTRSVGLAFVGVGRLGSALLRYYNQKFKEMQYAYYEPRALFDNDERKIGTELEGLPISSPEVMPEKVEERTLDVGVITVPAYAAQKAAELCVESGLKAILNFAPVPLELPDGIKVENVDLTVELVHLGFYI